MWLYLLYASIVTPTTKYFYAGEVTRQILLIHAHTYHSSRRHVCTHHIDRHNRKKKKEKKDIAVDGRTKNREIYELILSIGWHEFWEYS